MNSPEFARGYGRPHAAKRSRQLSPLITVNEKVEDLLVEPRRWNFFLEELTYDHLRGYEMWDADLEHLDIDDYIEWSSRNIPDIYTELTTLALEDPKLLPYLTELNFHLIAPHLPSEWHGLVESNAETRSVDTLTRSQSALALVSMNLSERLEGYDEEGKRRLTGFVHGQQTEIDTMIVELHRAKSKTMSHKLSVPASVRFENTNASINADSLDIDETYREARGLQSKTNESGNVNKNKSYDRRFVTVVDGFRDLENRVAEYNSRGQKMYVARPGLISAEHLDRTPLEQLPGYRQGEVNETLAAMKTAAAALLPKRQPTIHRAAHHIDAKIRDDTRRIQKAAS
jgi:hypothetical protein